MLTRSKIIQRVRREKRKAESLARQITSFNAALELRGEAPIALDTISEMQQLARHLGQTLRELSAR